MTLADLAHTRVLVESFESPHTGSMWWVDQEGQVWYRCAGSTQITKRTHNTSRQNLVGSGYHHTIIDARRTMPEGL